MYRTLYHFESLLTKNLLRKYNFIMVTQMSITIYQDLYLVFVAGEIGRWTREVCIWDGNTARDAYGGGGTTEWGTFPQNTGESRNIPSEYRWVKEHSLKIQVSQGTFPQNTGGSRNIPSKYRWVKEHSLRIQVSQGTFPQNTGESRNIPLKYRWVKEHYLKIQMGQGTFP